MGRPILALSILIFCAPSVFSLEPATVSVAALKDVSLRIYGFVESDLITDSRQGFSESQANSLVAKDNTFSGSHRRTQMSARQSRLGLALDLPETSGWKTEGLLELDFYGNQGPNTAPGSAPGAQTERDFFNNPSLRVRHAVLDATNGRWDFKAGQYWSLFGWQTEYFPPEITVQSTPGQLNNRTAQMRAAYTADLGDGLGAQAAAAIQRPAEMNSGSPVYVAATRLFSSKLQSNVNTGYGSAVKSLSAAVSLEVVPLETQGYNNPTCEALAFQVLVPIIPASKPGDKANNLAFVGESVVGSGIGGTELPLLTMGTTGPTAQQVGTAIDSGLAALDAQGNVQPLKVRTFRGALTYTLPDPRWAVSAGYAQVEGRGLDRFSTSVAVSNAISPKAQYGWAAAFWDPKPWLRLAAEFSQTRDTYNDPNARFATNNRVQVSSFFVF